MKYDGKKWNKKMGTLRSLGNEMNSHCHFQNAGFGLKEWVSLSHLPPALDTVTDTHGDRRVEGVGVGFEEMLVENGSELRRQNPSCTQKTKRKNGDSSTSKSVLHYSRKWKTKRNSEGKRQISQPRNGQWTDGWCGPYRSQRTILEFVKLLREKDMFI